MSIWFLFKSSIDSVITTLDNFDLRELFVGSRLEFIMKLYRERSLRAIGRALRIHSIHQFTAFEKNEHLFSSLRPLKASNLLKKRKS